MIESPADFIDPTPLFRGDMGSISDLAIGASHGISEVLPGMTTLIIIATFIMTIYQAYKYYKHLMLNTKGMNYEDF